MDRPTSSDQLNPAPNSLSYFQGTPLAESGVTGQAFSRDVEEVAVTLSSVHAGEAATHHFQPTVFFHNPFDNPAFEKRSIEIVYRHLEEDQPLDLTVRKEPPSNHPAPTYIPDKESFSIQSILGKSTSQNSSVVDTNLYQPLQIPNQNGIGAFSKPESPTASDKLIYTELNARTVTHPPLQGASCGETSVNFSQPPSCPVTIIGLLNKGIQQQATNATAEIERLESIVISESLTITPGEASQKAYHEVFKSTGDREKARIAGKQATALIKESNIAKNNEVGSTSISPPPPPLFSLKTEGIFTVQIEPISP